MGKERDPRTPQYLANRRRVCEIYGLDPSRASVHHIVERSAGGTDELSNLYPFPANGKGKSPQHRELHRLIEAIEEGRIADIKDGKSRLKILFESSKDGREKPLESPIAVEEHILIVFDGKRPFCQVERAV